MCNTKLVYPKLLSKLPHIHGTTSSNKHQLSTSLATTKGKKHETHQIEHPHPQTKHASYKNSTSKYRTSRNSTVVYNINGRITTHSLCHPAAAICKFRHCSECIANHTSKSLSSYHNLLQSVSFSHTFSLSLQCLS